MFNARAAAAALLMIAATTGLSQAADLPPESYSTSGWYLRADAGYSWLSWDRRDDYEPVAGVGAGYSYNDHIRADLRADFGGMFDAIAGNNDVAITTALANVYYDIPFTEVFTPYVGVGAGYGWVDTHGFDSSGFAFAAMAGFEMKVVDQVSLDFGYRFRDIQADDVTHENQFSAGVRFGF